MITLAYNCKYCHRPGSAQCDDTLTWWDLQSWSLFLACNRCADFRTEKSRIEERAQRLCTKLNAARNGGLRPDRLVEFEKALAEKLARFCRDYCHRVAAHLRIADMYSDELIDLLMEKPLWARFALNDLYARCCRNRTSLQPDMLAEPHVQQQLEP